jgi:hypothetical protein
MWSGHAPSEWRVHQNCRLPWRKQVCQGSDLLIRRRLIGWLRAVMPPFMFACYGGRISVRTDLHHGG